MVLVYMVLVKVIVCMFTFFHVKIITQEGKPPDLKIGVRNWKPHIEYITRNGWLPGRENLV